MKKLIEGTKFARKCDITGEGMNEGYCVNDGEMYIKNHLDLVEYLKSLGYQSIEEAYDDEVYYHTIWEDKEDFQYIVKNGELVEIDTIENITIDKDEYLELLNTKFDHLTQLNEEKGDYVKELEELEKKIDNLTK